MPKIAISGGKRTLQIMASEHKKLSEALDLVISVNDAADDDGLKAKATESQNAICDLIAALPAAPAKK